METADHAVHADPMLLKGWLTARSIARKLPQPVPEHGGLRVETGLPQETRRYVFARPEHSIRALAQSIIAPNIFIKMCGTGEQLMALVPSHWQLRPTSYLMTTDRLHHNMPPLPIGYRLELSTEQSVTMARVLAEDDSLAASGYAAEHDGYFVYDRIGTEAAHRRLGLGRAIMMALASTRQSSDSQQVLVATEEGRALYSTLGWIMHSPYSTAFIAAPET